MDPPEDGQGIGTLENLGLYSGVEERDLVRLIPLSLRFDSGPRNNPAYALASAGKSAGDRPLSLFLPKSFLSG